MTLAEIIKEGEYVIEKWAPEGTVLREVQGVPIRVATLERLLAVARAAVRCANDGCGCVRTEPDPDGVGTRILWCPDRWPGDEVQWCWSCQMRAVAARRGQGGGERSL